MEDNADEQPVHAPQARGRRIKKRDLKNKALSVTFDEKDLRNYVTGFHKRKKKRRKEAQKQQEGAVRRKRIELRKKRKLERELVYGGAPPTSDSASEGSDEFPEEDGESDPIASISGTTTYDNGHMKVTVTTSEISHEEEAFPNEKTQAPVAQPIRADRKHNVPIIKKKPFKMVAKHKSRPRPQNKRDKRKGKKKTQKRH